MKNSDKKIENNSEENKSQKDTSEKNGKNKTTVEPVSVSKSNRWLIAIIFILLLIIVWGLMFYVLNLKGIFSEIPNFFNLRSDKYATEESAKESLKESQNGNAADQSLASNVATNTNISQDNNPATSTVGTEETSAGGIEIPTGSGQAGTGSAADEEDLVEEEDPEEDEPVEEDEPAEEEAPLDNYNFAGAIDSILDSFNSLSSSAVYDSSQLNASELSL